MKLEIRSKRITEANIQAEFYHQCRRLKIPVYLEYKHEKSRFDAVIYDENSHEIYALIEVKNYVKQRVLRRTKQFVKYEQYKIPLFVITHSGAIRETIINILRLMYLKQVDNMKKKSLADMAITYKAMNFDHLDKIEKSFISRYRIKKINASNKRNNIDNPLR